MRPIALATLLLAFATSASATSYWTAEDAERARAEFANRPLTERPSPAFRPGVSSYLSDFYDATWFIASLQVTDSLSADYGGIREGEHLPDIIQTDNTSESIWMFSRYYELTGDATILPYLDRSWIYVLNHPAYDEEGGSLPIYGYYRYYNCGWALRAGLKYEEVFSDPTHVAYVDSCASYLATKTLNIDGAPAFNAAVNPPVLAWGAANLRMYGVANADSLWSERGWKRGRRAKDWIVADPAILGTEEWAMSGGAAMWGVLESYFDEFPAEEATWVATYAGDMDTFSDPGTWENAWQGWYALGLKRLEESTGDSSWGTLHQSLTDYLNAFDDTDQDGGIMANPADLDTEDQGWVTSYLGFMGFEPLLLEATDAPVIVASTGGSLRPNSPNPFSPQTTIPFELRRADDVALDVFDVHGARVVRLVDGPLPAGSHRTAWDGRDARGRSTPAGVYFYRLRTNSGVESRKMLRLR